MGKRCKNVLLNIIIWVGICYLIRYDKIGTWNLFFPLIITICSFEQ